MPHFSNTMNNMFHALNTQRRYLLACAFQIVLYLVAFPYESAASSHEMPKYTPLIDALPGLSAGRVPTMVEYINLLFSLIISLAAIAAVVRIVLAGFKYMTTDSWGNKEEARSNLKAIFIGLLVLLLSVIILRTINPDILNLNIFQNQNALPK
jgi:hypothetical protein